MSALGWVKVDRQLLWAEPLASDLAAFGLYVHIRLVASRGVHHSPQGLVPANSAFLSLNRLASKCGLSRRTLIAKLNVLVDSKLIEFSVSKMGALVTLLETQNSVEDPPENDEKGLGHMAQPLGYTAQAFGHMAQGLGYTAQHIQEEKRRELLPSREQVASESLKPTRKRKPKPGSVTLEQAIEKSPLFELWNSHVNPGLPRVAGADAKRLEAACARWAENPSREYWVDLIARLNASSFLNGKGPTGWKADFDWLIRPSSVLRLSEGKYDDRYKSAPLPDLSLPKRDEMREAQEEAERQAFLAWYADSGFANIAEALAVYDSKTHKASGNSA